MANNVIIQDVCEVFLTDLKDTSKVYFFGITTKNEVTQKVKQDLLKGGIGNSVVGVVQSDKEINFKVTTLLHNDDIYAIQSGSAFATGTSTIQMKEEGVVATGKITITGTPIGSTVIVFDKDGKSVEGTYATGQVTVTGMTDGDIATVIYSASATNAEALTLDSKVFPHNYAVQLHTIAYDVDTNVICGDIYWVFDKALPDGGISAQYEAGKQNGDDINFTAMVKRGFSKYGQYIYVPAVAV